MYKDFNKKKELKMQTDRPEEVVKVLMNPVRLRIIQYFAVHETGTVSQIREELTEIPPASLYRHIKMLCAGNYITVTGEKKIRGTVEKTYTLTPMPFGEMTKENAGQVIQALLLSLLGNFTKYFAKEDADPEKDMISVSTSTMFLTDGEMMEMLSKISEILLSHINNKKTQERKARRITFISLPDDKDD